jgi:hypothetical protein
MIALKILDTIEDKEEANKWDLIKVLGNEAQFGVWIEKFFLVEMLIEERREGRYYYYRKTERGELLHKLLRSGSMINIFTRISGKKLRE